MGEEPRGAPDPTERAKDAAAQVLDHLGTAEALPSEALESEYERLNRIEQLVLDHITLLARLEDKSKMSEALKGYFEVTELRSGREMRAFELARLKAEQDHRVEELQIVLKMKQQEFDRQNSEEGQRRRYAPWIMGGIAVWVFLLLVLLVASRLPGTRLELSDSLLISLFGATTASIISLAVIVVKFLYHRPGSA